MNFESKLALDMTNREVSFMNEMPEAITKLPGAFLFLRNNGFFTAPASANHHGNYEGGLFDHSLQVTKELVKLTMYNHLNWERAHSPYIVGMFHDLCKIDSYKWVQSPAQEVQPGIRIHKADGHWEYNTDTLLKGHGEKSVMILSTLMQLTEEEMLCIRYHMGAFTDEAEWKYYNGAINRYPNVLWTHHADMIASHVQGV